MLGVPHSAGPGALADMKPPSSPMRTTSAASPVHGKFQHSVLLTLERERARLAETVGRDSAAHKHAQDEVSALQAQVLDMRAKLGSYNALFARVADADVRAPKQKLGAVYACTATARILQKERERLANEAVSVELKINRAKEKNAGIRREIDLLRRDAVTYLRLFNDMRGELMAIKGRIAAGDAEVEGYYAQRDRAFDEMRELVKQFELSKLERAAEFKSYSATLAALDAAAAAHAAVVGTGAKHAPSNALISEMDLRRLRDRISTATARVARERALETAAQRRLAAFTSALDSLRVATRAASANDLVALFNRFEEHKFTKAKLAQRLLGDIEKLEGEVTALQEEVHTRDDANAKLKLARSSGLEALERNAVELETQAAETNEGVKIAVSEVRALYRVIEYAFQVLGVQSRLSAGAGAPTPAAVMPTRSALTSPSSPLSAPGGRFWTEASPPGGQGSPASQGRRPDSSQFGANNRMKLAIRSGVSASTLGVFIGIIESRSAEIIQQYAAWVTRMQEEYNSQAAAAAAAARAAMNSPGSSGSPSTTGAPSAQPSLNDAGVAASIHMPAMFAAGSGDAARRLLASVALGPSTPSGKSREIIATNALVAAMTVDAMRMADDPIDAADDGSRPLTLEELKRQATHRLRTDKAVRQVRQAATVAASVLVGGQHQ